MDTDDWAQERASWKAHREERIAKELEAAKKTCEGLGVEIKEFNPNSFRLTKPGYPTLDWYPKSRKIYNHGKKRWTNSVRVIASLIELNFK